MQQKDVHHGGQYANLKELLDAMSPAQQSQVTGLGCGKLTEPLPKYIKAPCEYVVGGADGHNGSYIVLGRDRPGGTHPAEMGYGPKGHTGTAMLDLVVGRNSAAFPGGAKLENEEGEALAVNPHFVNDAARIYISQKSDVDDYFGLDPGTVGNKTGKSCVAMKADGVRLIAREGIKLVTATGQFNSRGHSNNGKAGVDLIYGNESVGGDYGLEPLVKGTRLVTALNEMMDMIGTLSGMTTDLCLALLQLGGDYAAHQHIGNFGGPTPGTTNISAGIKLILDNVNVVSNKCVNFQVNHAMWKTNNTNPFGGNFICSKWHNAN
jgi:hypothetical protein